MADEYYKWGHNNMYIEKEWFLLVMVIAGISGAIMGGIAVYVIIKVWG